MGLLVLAQLASEPLVVDRVVARVDDDVITQSELTAETRLVLVDARNPGLALSAELTPELLSAVLESMVHRRLLMNEMQRLQLREAPDSEIAEAVDRLARRFEDREAFRRFLVDIGMVDPDAPDDPRFRAPAAIVDRLRAEREVARFVDVRIRPNVVMSDREVRACYQAHPERFGDLPYAKAEPRIRLRLRAQKEARALRQLIEQLSKRARIRVVPEYDVARAPEPDDLGFRCPEKAP